MAKLYFRYGSMNSGKTTALIQTAYNYEERGMRVLIIKPKIDTKGENKIVSRIGATRKVDYLISKNDKIKDLQYKNHNCILVDEAQFLTKKQIEELFEIACLEDIPVICYGLRTDFMSQGFEGSKRLLELAHSIEELKTICRCGRKAILTIRKVNDKPVFSGNQVEIDNNSKIEYESVCGTCYLKARKG